MSLHAQFYRTTGSGAPGTARLEPVEGSAIALTLPARIEVVAIGAGNQAIVGKSDALACSLALGETKATATKTLAEAGKVLTDDDLPALHVEGLGTDRAQRALAVSVVLDRGDPPDLLGRVLDVALSALDAEGHASDAVAGVFSAAAGTALGGIAGLVVGALVAGVREAVIEAIFGEHILVAAHTAVSEDSSAPADATYVVADLRDEDTNVGHALEPSDFVVDPATWVLWQRRTSSLERADGPGGMVRSPRPYAVVRIHSDRA